LISQQLGRAAIDDVDYVGIVRTTRRLERAQHRIRLLRRETDEYYANFRVSRDLLELRNLLECADMIVRSACDGTRAAACITADYPQTLPASLPTILVPPSRMFRSRSRPDQGTPCAGGHEPGRSGAGRKPRWAERTSNVDRIRMPEQPAGHQAREGSANRFL